MFVVYLWIEKDGTFVLKYSQHKTQILTVAENRMNFSAIFKNLCQDLAINPQNFLFFISHQTISQNMTIPQQELFCRFGISKNLFFCHMGFCCQYVVIWK